MINPNNAVDEAIEKIKANQAFNQCEVVKAYSKNIWCEDRCNPLIAVSINSIDAENENLSESDKVGSQVLICDIYVPDKNDISDLTKLSGELCECLMDLSIVSLSVSKAEHSEDLMAYHRSCAFTFSDLIEFREE